MKHPYAVKCKSCGYKLFYVEPARDNYGKVLVCGKCFEVQI